MFVAEKHADDVSHVKYYTKCKYFTLAAEGPQYFFFTLSSTLILFVFSLTVLFFFFEFHKNVGRKYSLPTVFWVTGSWQKHSVHKALLHHRHKL